MKKLLTILFATALMTSCGQRSNEISSSQNSKQDNMKAVQTIGIFDGVLITKTGYKINEYYISQEEMTTIQVDTFKGKRIVVNGKLKIVKGNQSGNIQNTSEDRMYITEPKFTYYIYKEPEGFISPKKKWQKKMQKNKNTQHNSC